MEIREAVKLIEDGVTDTLPERRELAVREKAEKKLTRVVGGFQFDDPQVVEQSVEAAKQRHRDTYDRYCGHCARLEDKLAGLGITAMAFVPSGYWAEITKAHRLVTVSPLLDGRVQVLLEVPHKIGRPIAERCDKLLTGLFSLTVIAAIVGVILAGAFSASGPVEAFGMFVRSPVSFFMYGGFALMGLVSFMKSWLISRALRNWLDTHTTFELVDAMTSYNHYAVSTWSAVRMPTPPADVVVLLRKLADANERFDVTAVPEALLFTPSLESLFMKGYHEQERLIEEERRRDPIITISQNGVTAILAQFGEFEWERRVIEDVLWSKPLPVADGRGHEYF